MRTLTLLSAAVLCALPHAQHLAAQDAPIVIADNSSIPPGTANKGEQGKKEKGKKSTKTQGRTIQHSAGFTPVQGNLFFAKDPASSMNTPVCFEMAHDSKICNNSSNPQACRDQYYVDLSSATTWTLALNGGVVLPWYPAVSNEVAVNTDGATITSSSMEIEDTSNSLTSATLTTTTGTSTFPGNLQGATPPLTFIIHYCNGKNKVCTGADNKDHCKNHQ